MSDFPHDKETPIGETDEMAEEEKAYEASETSTAKSPAGDDHALGGTEGTTDGT